jgi:hypothetical protein
MRRLLPPGLDVACFLALLAACFGPVLFGDRQFSYRDAAHFYYPLYQRVQQEWEAGRLPLWEPEENAGMPLLGNPTAAVLYPGKLIFAALSYPRAARLYVVLHVALAAGAMFLLMRHWQVSRTGSTLAALSYAFGMPVLFQYCNIVFLVGAAWMPLGLRGCDRWLRLGRRWGLVELALVLALQTLGGDPEAAYLVGLCGGGYALLLNATNREDRRTRRRWPRVLLAIGLAIAWIAGTLALAAWLPPLYRSQAELPANKLVGAAWLASHVTPGIGRALVLAVWGVSGLIVVTRDIKRRGSALTGRLLGLAGAGALAAALIGVQLLPTLEFTGQTLRATEEAGHETYQFSLEPHRLAELAWPGFFGSTRTGNHSWLGRVLPNQVLRIWIPSLYIGAWTLALAAGAGGARAGRGWLAAIAAISLAASLGQFASPLYVARFVPAAAEVVGPHDPLKEAEMRRDHFLPDGFGSPYGLMAGLLPGFGAFRYPSKLLVFTSLALSGLAGMGWDRAAAGRSRRAVLVAAVGATIGLVVLAGSFRFESRWLAYWLSDPRLVANATFGPFDASGALRETRRALTQGAVVLVLGGVLAAWARRAPGWAGALAVVLLAADLGIANAGYVFTCPQSVFDEKPEVLARIEAAERAEGATEPYRIHRMPIWEPPGWAQRASTDRPLDFVRWERRTIQPKYALPYHACYTLTQGTTELFDYWFFFAPFYGNADASVGALLKLPPGEKVVYYPRRGYDLWNSKYFVLPLLVRNEENRGVFALLPETDVVAPPELDSGSGKAVSDRWRMEEDWQVLRNRRAFPRAWVVHQARFPAAIVGLRKADRQPRMEEILYEADDLWNSPTRILYDPRQLAWVETDDPASLRPFLPGGLTSSGEAPRITRYESQRVEIEVRMDSPGLLILSDVYYPGWWLTVDGQPASILRANRLMRGVALRAGPHHVVFRYDPPSLRNGVMLSVAGLLALAGVCGWCARQPRPPAADEAPSTEPISPGQA